MRNAIFWITWGILAVGLFTFLMLADFADSTYVLIRTLQLVLVYIANILILNTLLKKKFRFTLVTTILWFLDLILIIKILKLKIDFSLFISTIIILNIYTFL